MSTTKHRHGYGQACKSVGIHKGKVKIILCQSVEDSSRCVYWRDVESALQLLGQFLVQILSKGDFILLNRDTSDPKSIHSYVKSTVCVLREQLHSAWLPQDQEHEE